MACSLTSITTYLKVRCYQGHSSSFLKLFTFKSITDLQWSRRLLQRAVGLYVHRMLAPLASLRTLSPKAPTSRRRRRSIPIYPAWKGSDWVSIKNISFNSTWKFLILFRDAIMFVPPHTHTHHQLKTLVLMAWPQCTRHTSAKPQRSRRDQILCWMLYSEVTNAMEWTLLPLWDR